MQLIWYFKLNQLIYLHGPLILFLLFPFLSTLIKTKTSIFQIPHIRRRFFLLCATYSSLVFFYFHKSVRFSSARNYRRPACSLFPFNPDPLFTPVSAYIMVGAYNLQKLFRKAPPSSSSYLVHLPSPIEVGFLPIVCSRISATPSANSKIVWFASGCSFPWGWAR